MRARQFRSVLLDAKRLAVFTRPGPAQSRRSRAHALLLGRMCWKAPMAASLMAC